MDKGSNSNHEQSGFVDVLLTAPLMTSVQQKCPLGR